MNWNCAICGDDFALNPKATVRQGYGTFSDGTDTRFLCPAHNDAVADFIATEKVKHGQQTHA